MANMSKWYDPKDKYATYAHDVNISGVLLDYRALIVIEGNRPLDFPQNLENIREYYESHIKKASSPPHILLRQAAYASLHHGHVYYYHVPL